MIMEYQKINMLGNTPNQTTKFKTKNSSQIKFKTSMLRSGL